MIPKVVAFAFDEGAIAEFRMRMPMREMARQGLIELRAEEDCRAKKTEPGRELIADAQKPSDILLERLAREQTKMLENAPGPTTPPLLRGIFEEGMATIKRLQHEANEARPHREVSPEEAAANQRRYDGWATDADLLFTQRYVTGERGRLYSRLARPPGIPWIMDVDDQVLALDRENPGFRGYAAKAPSELGECRAITDVSEQRDDEVCMKHKKTGQILAVKLKQQYPRGLTYAQMMGADALICGTEELRKYYGQMRRSEHKPDHLYMIPYSISTDAWSRVEPKDHGSELRVGWLGAEGHQREMAFLGHVADHVLGKYPNTKFYWKSTMNKDVKAYFERHPAGCAFTPLLEATKRYPGRCVQIEEWVSHDEWPQAYADINLDIVLAPLADTAFKRCVSPIKWVEAAMLRKPCVCSTMPGYQEVIRQWRNGVLCGELREWIRAIDRLIDSKDRRDAIGGRAHEKAMAEFSMEKNAARYAEAFQEVIRDLGPRARDRAKEIAA